MRSQETHDLVDVTELTSSEVDGLLSEAIKADIEKHFKMGFKIDHILYGINENISSALIIYRRELMRS